MHCTDEMLPAIYLNIQSGHWLARAGRLQHEAEIESPMLALERFRLC
jgi:hypothetical protein